MEVKKRTWDILCHTFNQQNKPSKNNDIALFFSAYYQHMEPTGFIEVITTKNNKNLHVQIIVWHRIKKEEDWYYMYYGTLSMDFFYITKK